MSQFKRTFLFLLGISLSGALCAMSDVKTAADTKTILDEKELSCPQATADKKTALDAWRQVHTKSKQSIGFEKFFDLPEELQMKILEGQDLKRLYALRHKRELAPFIFTNTCDARVIIKAVDERIDAVKKTVNTATKNKSYGKEAAILVSSWLSEYLAIDSMQDFRKMSVYGYSDRTYEIIFDAEDEVFKNFVALCTFKQLMFLVSLARTIDLPEEKLMRLSLQDYAVFQTFDAEMQVLIEERYPWIDFYFPILKAAANLDERIEQIPNNMCAQAYCWVYWMVSKIQGWKIL